MITIKIDNASAVEAFNRLIAFGESPQPALKAIGEKVVEFTKTRFEQSADPKIKRGQAQIKFSPGSPLVPIITRILVGAGLMGYSGDAW